MNLTEHETAVLASADPEPYWAAYTADLRTFHLYNRTGSSCFGPVAKTIHGVGESVNIESIRHVLRACVLFISRRCQPEPL